MDNQTALKRSRRIGAEEMKVLHTRGCRESQAFAHRQENGHLWLHPKMFSQISSSCPRQTPHFLGILEEEV